MQCPLLKNKIGACGCEGVRLLDYHINQRLQWGIVPATQKKNRVVVTGMATINPLGDTLEDYISNLYAGKSGIRRWESIDTSQLQCKIGGDLGDYDCRAALRRLENVVDEERMKKVVKMFKTTTFSAKTAILCALRAFQDADLFHKKVDMYECAVIVAGHNLNSKYLYKNTVQYQKEPDFIDALSGVEGIDPNVPGAVSEALMAFGPAYTVGGACASGNLALRDVVRDIRGGEYECAAVVGAVFDMSECDLYASEFINATVVEPRFQETPAAASRPFDVHRCGFVYSHGTGTLIVESEESALRRGARIHAEVIDVVANSNACHLPLPNSDMQARLITRLIKNNGLKPEDIDYVNCHATGTPAGDIEEVKAIKKAFGAYATQGLKINAPKSMLGHVCWSAPIVETIGGILQMQRGRLHPTINIERLDPDIDLDVVPNVAVQYPVRYMLKNSFGFGGLNCSSLIGLYES